MTRYELYKRDGNHLPVQMIAPTGRDILGPFYRPGSPTRSRLSDSPTLFLSGTVRNTNGKLVDAYVDFWQADQDGKYDEDGPGFRGIQRTSNGCYALETIKPGYYDISDQNDPQPHEFRCSHIHAKIWVHGVDVLTTQLYFADSEYDDSDRWFSKDRCIKFSDNQHGTFDFVVKLP